MNFKKAYEYEKGKGDPNSNTTKQFDKIYRLFMDDVKTYIESSQEELGKKYFQEAALVLGQAFDIAISTENIKNRDKR
jgi:GH18 family chitinase